MGCERVDGVIVEEGCGRDGRGGGGGWGGYEEETEGGSESKRSRHSSRIRGFPREGLRG